MSRRTRVISTLRRQLARARREVKALKEWRSTAQPIIAQNKTNVEDHESRITVLETP